MELGTLPNRPLNHLDTEPRFANLLRQTGEGSNCRDARGEENGAEPNRVTMDRSIFSEQEKEAIRFLERDFNQCFQQMRHYDSQIFELSKFVFVAYTGLIALATGLYQLGQKNNLDFELAAEAVSSTGLILGLFLVGSVVRNRVYFVQVVRYINEQRGLFLALKPAAQVFFCKML
jgi:hypothetical protein